MDSVPWSIVLLDDSELLVARRVVAVPTIGGDSARFALSAGNSGSGSGAGRLADGGEAELLREAAIACTATDEGGASRAGVGLSGGATDRYGAGDGMEEERLWFRDCASRRTAASRASRASIPGSRLYGIAEEARQLRHTRRPAADQPIDARNEQPV